MRKARAVFGVGRENGRDIGYYAMLPLWANIRHSPGCRVPQVSLLGLGKAWNLDQLYDRLNPLVPNPVEQRQRRSLWLLGPTLQLRIMASREAQVAGFCRPYGARIRESDADPGFRPPRRTPPWATLSASLRDALGLLLSNPCGYRIASSLLRLATLNCAEAGPLPSRSIQSTAPSPPSPSPALRSIPPA